MMRATTPGIAIVRDPRGARRLWPIAALMAAGTVLPVTAGAASADVHQSTYRQVNLVSDIPGLAAATDSDLVNSWGVSASPGTDQAPGGALWVSDNGKDKTTLPDQMARHTACSESSYWLAETAVVGAAASPANWRLAGPARGPGKTPAGADAGISSCSSGFLRIRRLASAIERSCYLLDQGHAGTSRLSSWIKGSPSVSAMRSRSVSPTCQNWYGTIPRGGWQGNG